MHQSSNHSKFQRMRRRLDLFRQKKEEQSVSHPLRACLPFLCATGVLMTTVVTAASCTLCYRVDAQGQSLAFFHDVATYDAAVSQMCIRDRDNRHTVSTCAVRGNKSTASALCSTYPCSSMRLTSRASVAGSQET